MPSQRLEVPFDAESTGHTPALDPSMRVKGLRSFFEVPIVADTLSYPLPDATARHGPDRST